MTAIVPSGSAGHAEEIIFLRFLNDGIAWDIDLEGCQIFVNADGAVIDGDLAVQRADIALGTTTKGLNLRQGAVIIHKAFIQVEQKLLQLFACFFV